MQSSRSDNQPIHTRWGKRKYYYTLFFRTVPSHHLYTLLDVIIYYTPESKVHPPSSEVYLYIQERTRGRGERLDRAHVIRGSPLSPQRPAQARPQISSRMQNRRHRARAGFNSSDVLQYAKASLPRSESYSILSCVLIPVYKPLSSASPFGSLTLVHYCIVYIYDSR